MYGKRARGIEHMPEMSLHYIYCGFCKERNERMRMTCKKCDGTLTVGRRCGACNAPHPAEERSWRLYCWFCKSELKVVGTKSVEEFVEGKKQQP